VSNVRTNIRNAVFRLLDRLTLVLALAFALSIIRCSKTASNWLFQVCQVAAVLSQFKKAFITIET